MKAKFENGFTLIELLTVISVIAILSGMILNVAGYVQKKGARSRAQAEIKAIESACESYKADNGGYPMATGTTDQFTLINTSSSLISAASSDYLPTGTNYTTSSQYLYGQLSGDITFSGVVPAGSKVYMEFKPSQLGLQTSGSAISGSNKVQSINDPFGFSYGYSTSYNTTSGAYGYNPTFDLWSTAGTTTPAASGTQAKWITNWQ